MFVSPDPTISIKGDASQLPGHFYFDVLRPFMRIIGGRYKGKPINPPKACCCGSTTDFAKEALFNILNNRMHLEGLEVLDLCGTGNISFEICLAGGSLVSAVDANYRCCAFVRDTAGTLQLGISTFKAMCLFLKNNRAGSILFLPTRPVTILKILPKSMPGICRRHASPAACSLLSTAPNKAWYLRRIRWTRKYGNVNFSFCGLGLNSTC